MGGGVGAMADALLAGVGGRQVLLRIAAAAVAGDPGEQLGLATPEFQDVPLAPVVFRRTAGHELLVSAAALLSIAGTLASGSAEVLLHQAVGIVIDGLLYQIERVISAEAFGVVYLYRILLRPPVL